MSDLTIGWFGRSPHMTDAVFEVAATDAEVTVSGRIPHADTALTAVVYRQLLDLAANPAALPVRVGSAPALDGFYRVVSVDVTFPQGTTCGGWWPWSVTLAPVTPRNLPLHESRLIGTTRTNALSVTTSTRWHTPPVGTSRWSLHNDTPGEVVELPTSEGPAATYLDWDGADQAIQWRAPPAQWAMAGARITAGDPDASPSPSAVAFAPSPTAQTWTVPSGVTSIRFELGGASGAGYTGFRITSGLGAIVTGTLAVDPADELSFEVGHFSGNLGTPWFGGGLGGLRGGNIYSRMNGGDYCALYLNSTLVAIAGGGGGAGRSIHGAPVLEGGNAHIWGQDGAESGGTAYSGRGGTWTAGGAAGPGPAAGGATPGTPGTALQGGAGGDGTEAGGPAGGGGGGGYHGGGGGLGRVRSTISAAAGGGGGGASWWDDSVCTGITVTTRLPALIGAPPTQVDGFARITPTEAVDAPEFPRHLVCGPDRAIHPFGWALDNSIITCWPAVTGNAVVLVTQHGDQHTAWYLTDRTTTTDPVTSAAVATLRGADVLRCDPERVIIALDVEHRTVSGAVSAATVTVTMRRGSPLLTVTVDGIGAEWGWGADLTATATGTGYQTADGTLLTWTHGAVEGTKQWTATDINTRRATFGIGHVITDTDATLTPADLASMWMAATTETVRTIRP